jgi:hypothetical protein
LTPFSFSQRFHTLVRRSLANGRMMRLPFMSAAEVTSFAVMIE